MVVSQPPLPLRNSNFFFFCFKLAAFRRLPLKLKRILISGFENPIRTTAAILSLIFFFVFGQRRSGQPLPLFFLVYFHVVVVSQFTFTKSKLFLFCFKLATFRRLPLKLKKIFGLLTVFGPPLKLCMSFLFSPFSFLADLLPRLSRGGLADRQCRWYTLTA